MSSRSGASIGALLVATGVIVSCGRSQRPNAEIAHAEARAPSVDSGTDDSQEKKPPPPEPSPSVTSEEDDPERPPASKIPPLKVPSRPKPFPPVVRSGTYPLEKGGPTSSVTWKGILVPKEGVTLRLQIPVLQKTTPQSPLLMYMLDVTVSTARTVGTPEVSMWIFDEQDRVVATSPELSDEDARSDGCYEEVYLRQEHSPTCSVTANVAPIDTTRARTFRVVLVPRTGKRVRADIELGLLIPYE